MKRKKPIVLIFVRYYLPGFKSGGPVRSIANLVDYFGDNFDFRIVTSDRDVTDQTPYSDVDINGWNRAGKADVYYASPDRRSVRALAKLINATPHDVLYFNSFFDPVFTLRPLMARYFGCLPTRPVVVAPRGEFSPGALALRHWKKAPYLAAARAFGVYRNVTWQASSEYEAADIRRLLGKSARNIVVAPDLPGVVQGSVNRAKPAQRGDGAPLRIIFLSRISPMKNLDFALRALAKVSVAVELHIFGGIEDSAYWNSCQELIGRLPRQVSAIHHGVIEHALVHDTFSGYDLFFFPTRGENYGHVIFEALAAGVPVLTSDQTPWQDLDREGVGYVRPLKDEDAFVEVIERHSRAGAGEREEQAAKAHAYAQRIAADSDLVERNRALFINLALGNAKA